MANGLWFMSTLANARIFMISSFQSILDGKHNNAWNSLERAETEIQWMENNPFLSLDDYHVRQMKDMVSRWQSLFPYKIFGSPEFLIKQEICSICDQDTGPWSSCNHEKGKVYMGKLCIRIMKKVEIIGLSMVRDPVQKYSVIIPKTDDGSDPMNYGMVDWVAERVSGPFSVWDRTDTTKLYPHDAFPNLADDEICPCGSARTYHSCCKTKDGILHPHVLINFRDHPPNHLPKFTLNYKNKK